MRSTCFRLFAIVLMPRVVKSRDEIFSRWGYCDNHDLSRLDNQSIERDRLIGIGFVLNFVKFISFTFGDKEMISVIEAVRVMLLMPRVVKSRDEIFSRWGYCDNHDLSRLDNQSIERDRLIGIGFVLNFVKFISFTFGDKEMISVIEAIIREVFVKLLLKSSGKLSIRHGLYETIVCYVLLANMIWIVVLERDRLKALMDLSPTDNLIENLTNTLALLTQSYKTYLPQTNNQRHKLIKYKEPSTVQDDRVVVQNEVNDTSPFEELNKLPVQDLTLNVDNVFPTDECDAFDSDVYEAPTTQTIFMANLSSADPVYDEAGPSYDSDILSEVHEYDNYQDAVYEHNDAHEMHHDVQPNCVVDSNTDYTSNSNMIPYDQYVKDNTEPVPKVFQSANDMNKVVNASLTTELATYKEQVELYERRAKFELTKREQKIEEQFTEMHDAHTVVQACCLELESELSKLHDKVQKDDHTELVKRFSTLEELLEYVIGTCLKDFNKRDKKHASTPLTRKKQVTFEDQWVNSCTDASGSKPRSNTKKNRISSAKSVNKKKVEEHPRTNNSSLKNTNYVDSSISSKRTVINSNSHSVCKTCNKCSISANHDMCMVNYLHSVNASPSVKNIVRKVKKFRNLSKCGKQEEKCLPMLVINGSPWEEYSL
ncbi:hypothetical protein Tco_1514537 [Tanacetum coccineum]